MNDSLYREFNTFHEQRMFQLLRHLREVNKSYDEVCHKVRDIRETLKNEIDEDTWLKLKDLIRAMMTKSDVEEQYLYCNGLADCALLARHIDSSVVDGIFRVEPVDDDF